MPAAGRSTPGRSWHGQCHQQHALWRHLSSSTSDTASIGSVLIPEMKKRGYPLHHASGITVASSTMGMVLPPSIPMVIFAIAGQVSIGRLFLGGILPGLIVGVLQLAAVAWMASRNHYPREEHPPSWSASGVLLMRSMHVLLMPILLVGSIVFGIATATESAAIGALYAVAIGGLVHRELTWKKCLDALIQSARLSAQIMMIIAFSQVFVWMLALERTPQALAEGLMALNLSPSMLLLIIVALVLIIGTVIDVSPGILLLTPIFMPVVAQAGISPVWFWGRICRSAGRRRLHPSGWHLPECLCCDFWSIHWHDLSGCAALSRCQCNHVAAGHPVSGIGPLSSGLVDACLLKSFTDCSERSAVFPGQGLLGNPPLEWRHFVREPRWKSRQSPQPGKSPRYFEHMPHHWECPR